MANKVLKQVTFSLLITSLLMGMTGCKGKSSAPSATTSTYSCNNPVLAKGARLLGADILNAPENGTYGDNYTTLKAMHANFQPLHLTWTDIETTAGSGTTSGIFVDPGTALATFSSYAQTDGIKLALTIRPVDATGKTLPSDLSSARFNSATMIARFKKVIDYVLTKIDPSHLTALMIGNEIDNYDPLGDTNFWTDYAAFLFAMESYVNTNYPGLKVGFTATAEGFISNTKTTADGWNTRAILQAWAGNVDVVGITYYPLKADFTMKAPSIVSSDFSSLVGAVPSGKTIHIQEIGYPTSSMTNSDESAQRQFFCEAMKAWDDNASRITQMSVLRMNDITRARAETMAGPYGVSTEPFIEYLRTLGLRNSLGIDKLGMTLLKSELSKRGF